MSFKTANTLLVLHDVERLFVVGENLLIDTVIEKQRRTSTIYGKSLVISNGEIHLENTGTD